jgi:hypothetical protein
VAENAFLRQQLIVLARTPSRAFLDQLMVSPADKERIAHGNAERLLGV